MPELLKAHAEIIARISEAYGIEKKWGSSAELAEKMGVSANTISTWKKRGAPAEILIKTSRETGCSLMWLELGGDEPSLLPKHSTTNETATAAGAMDRELLIEAASIIKEAEIRLNVQIRPDKLGELILMLYDDYATGVEVAPARVLQLVKMAA